MRKTFRFTEKQKKLLMEIVMKGEDCGQKISPDQVHQDLRKKLTPNEYVTSQQIRVLSSR